jgi:hypothetical protein
MEVKIEITEGCMCYSYTINGIEYGDLIDKESDDYNPDFVYDVLEAMTNEIYKQRKDNQDLITVEIENSQWFFERLVQFNNNTEVTDISYCEQCGDTIITKSLTINIE